MVSTAGTRVSRAAWIAVAGALLTGCAQAPALPQASGYPPAGGLRAWVDAPLDGTSLSLPVTYPVVCHGTDASGVAAVEFSADGNVLETATNPSPSLTLFTARFAWQPTTPGNYILRCRAQNQDGQWSGAAAARVEVLASVTPSDTPTPTLTPSPTPTVTPTPTARLTPEPAGLVFAAQVSAAEFHYPRDCVPDPSAVTITVAVSGAPQPTGVTLFFRFRDQSTGESGAWNEGLGMVPLGGGRLRASVSWEAIPGIDALRSSGDPAWFLYQFVATGPQGTIIGRSQTSSDITLTACQ